MLLGDHPDCSSGPPVTIGWDCEGSELMTVDDFEARRAPVRRSGDGLKLRTSYRRFYLKVQTGCPEWAIREAEYKVEKIKAQREKARSSGRRFERVEELFQSAQRKARRRLGLTSH